MQIHYATARSMGYSGPAAGLLDADVNLRYAVKYLRGAWLCSGRDPDRAVHYYASGYYYVAKHLGLLDEVGL
jgi:soluble lytic murein transglycosylase-like protein